MSRRSGNAPVICINILMLTGCRSVSAPVAVSWVEPDTLVYQGPLSKEANDRVFTVYRNAPARPRLLRITSGGGDPDLGMDLGEWVFRNGLDVEIADHCFSSCANYVFPAGKAKILNPDSILLWHGGAHQTDLEEQLRRSAEKASEQVRQAAKAQLDAWRKREDAFFTTIGVNQSITTYGQTAPHVVRPKNTIGYDYSIEDLAKFGITNVVEKGGSWRWRELRPGLEPGVFRVDVRLTSAPGR